MGQFIGNGGALSTGRRQYISYGCSAHWHFLKTAQKFDSYLAAMGLNVAQTGSSMGMELLMAARVISGVGRQRKERRQRVRQGRFDCNRNRGRGQRLCIRLCQQIQG